MWSVAARGYGLGGALLLAGIMGAAVPKAAGAQTFRVGWDAEIEVSVAPPAPYSVAVEPMYGYTDFDSYDGYSYDGHVWVQGHWTWDGYDWQWLPGYWTECQPGHVWIDGYWMTTSRRTYRWVPGRWETIRPGHYFHPGYWNRDGDHWHWERGTWIAMRSGYDWEPGRWLTTGSQVRWSSGRFRESQRRHPRHQREERRSARAVYRSVQTPHREESRHFRHDNFRNRPRSDPRGTDYRRSSHRAAPQYGHAPSHDYRPAPRATNRGHQGLLRQRSGPSPRGRDHEMRSPSPNRMPSHAHHSSARSRSDGPSHRAMGVRDRPDGRRVRGHSLERGLNHNHSRNHSHSEHRQHPNH